MLGVAGAVLGVVGTRSGRGQDRGGGRRVFRRSVVVGSPLVI